MFYLKNSNFYKFFSYNWFKIISKNVKNNRVSKLDNKSFDELSGLVFKKEICAIVFVLINFLITYVSSREMYSMNYNSFVFFRILKDNIFTSLVWFIVLTVLPFVTIILMKKKLKSKYYLLVSFAYLFSNVFNILLSVYFITALINTKFFGILGIINIIITVLINCNIIIRVNENYLK